MKLNDVAKTTRPLEVDVLQDGIGEPAGTMTLPTGTAVRIDSHEPADRSVGIFCGSVVFEIGALATGNFYGAGIYVEHEDSELDLAHVPFCRIAA